uniref:Rx N-terminal domain-containing protein n=1 Tax=Glycine max TaxID=3847 RepID=A0A0R0FXH5_SOYBN
MAEYFVFDIAESLLGKLASYVYEQASRACDLYEDVQGIIDTLSIVKGVLLDAEEKHGLLEWLRQIQNICFDVEDVLDGYECQSLRKHVVKASCSTKMKRIDIDHRLVQRREITYSHVNASGVIGMDGDKDEIIKLLMQPHPHHGDGDGDKMGIGGLGKTKLAKLVFTDKRMDELFQLKMWVCISDDVDISQIIIKIINSASSSALTIAFTHQENVNNLDIDLWVALELLGLLGSPVGSGKVENIARQYIDERSLLEDFEDYGHLYHFKVHDLVHDLALYVAKEELLVVNSQTRNIPEQVRHFSVVENDSLSHALFPKSTSFFFRREQLTSLEVLTVQSCGTLESLPLHILPKLEVLFVIGCEMLNMSLNFESSIHRLRMKFLHLEHCPRPQTLPQWIQGTADTLQTLLI